MGKKILLITILILIVILAGVFYRLFFLTSVPPTGKVFEVKMKVLENQWKFEPDSIEIRAGDKIIINIFNEDNYDHGFAIDAFGINKRLIPKAWTRIEFLASKRGEFIFYCSVPCGKGHFDQKGILIVK